MSKITPMHYMTDSRIDVIDFCKMYDMNFNRGNIVKYLARAGKKDNELDGEELKTDEYYVELKYSNNDKGKKQSIAKFKIYIIDYAATKLN